MNALIFYVFKKTQFYLFSCINLQIIDVAQVLQTKQQYTESESMQQDEHFNLSASLTEGHHFVSALQQLQIISP